MQSIHNNLAEAAIESLRRTRDRCTKLDLIKQAKLCDFKLDIEGNPTLRFLGRSMRILANEQNIFVIADDGQPVSVRDEALVLRCLETPRSICPLNDPITFRDLPGGAFYYGPVKKRTSELIVKKFENDLEALKKNIERFPHTIGTQGDMTAIIHVLSKIDVTLVYHLGEEGIPPEVDFIYDRIIQSVYHADEVAALATRISFELIKPSQ